jgi:hypothetical protein
LFEWDIPIAPMWLACPHAHVPYDCPYSAATEAPRCKIAPLIICICGARCIGDGTAVALAVLVDGDCTAGARGPVAGLPAVLIKRLYVFSVVYVPIEYGLGAIVSCEHLCV